MSRLATLRRPLAVLAAAALAAASLAACSSGPGQIGATTLGQLIPVKDRVAANDVGGTLVTGTGTAHLADDKGHPVIVDFFAQWCGPCTLDTPALDTVYRSMKADGVRAIGFDTKDPGPAGPQFLASNKISFPFVSDEPGKALLGIGNIPAKDLPVTVLVDKQQRIAAVYLGRYTAKDIQTVVGKLAAES